MHPYYDPDLAEYSFGVLFMTTWQAAVLIGLSSVAAACLRRDSTRGSVWSACLVGLAVVPVISLLAPHCFLAYRGASEPLHFPTLIVRAEKEAASLQKIWTFGEGGWDDRVCRTLLYVWICGVVAAVMRLAWSCFDTLRIIRLARPVSGHRVQTIAQKVMGPNARTQLLELDGLVGAICWQIHRPKLLITAGTSRLTDDEVEMMIRHEWAHLRRNDPLMLFVQRLVEIVYWFHPMVWWTGLQISKYREFLCDDRVIESGHARMSYACCLGQLAVRYYSPAAVVPQSLGIAWNQHLLLKRVRRIMHGSQESPRLTNTTRCGLVASAIVSMILVAVFRWDWGNSGIGGVSRWTAWPSWSASVLDLAGLRVRDYPLDAHLYDPDESERKHIAVH